MSGGTLKNRDRLIACLTVLMWVFPAAAQLPIVDALHLHSGGDVEVGYIGDISTPGSSDHGLTLGGDGNIGGYYYNPSFISFSAAPYYNRSQSNSTSSSILDNSGYNASVSLFGGSHFPATATLVQTWNSTGNFGIPGTAGLTTNGDSRSLSFGWALLLPGLPTVSMGYGQSSSTSSVFGSSAQGTSTTHNFSIRSAYTIAGFGLGASYSHLSLDSGSNILTTGNGTETEATTTNNISFNAKHKLPLHGSFNVNYSRSNYSSSDTESGTSLGGGTGTTDSASASASVKVGIFPISGSAEYSDNLYGSVLEQQLASGTPVFQTTISPESRSLLVDVSSSYRLLHTVFITGFISEQEQSIYGQTYGVTQYGANANYNFGRRLKGLTITLGINDSADKAGNLGAGLISNVSYYRKVGPWTTSANFNYNQNVQTLLALYTVSTMSYTSTARRQLPKHINWNVGAGGGRSGFTEQAGSESHSESVSSSLGWRGYTVGGNYSRSSGTSVLTAQGLVAQTVPVATANELVVYDGTSYGLGVSAAPLRNMSVSLSYGEATSTTQGANLNNNNTVMLNGLLMYHYRKVFINAGFTRFRQETGGVGSGVGTGVGSGLGGASQPGTVTSYYFGISRWFKFF